MIPGGMSEVKAATGALPLSVFEDRGAPLEIPAANNNTAADFISSPPAGRPSLKQQPDGNAQEARKQRKRKQPEGTIVLDSSLGSVMTLRSHQAPADRDSGQEGAAGFNELLIPDLTTPPSPRSMEILGRSRGLKRANLVPNRQQRSPLKKGTLDEHPQSAQMYSPAARMHSEPASQPVGSNWWAAGQPMQHPGALPAGQQHHLGWQGAAEQVWHPGYQSPPRWPGQQVNKHAPSHPALEEGSGVASAGPRHGRALKRQRASQHAPPAEAQPCLPRANVPSHTPYHAQGALGGHLVGETIAHAVPACWAGRLSHCQQDLACLPAAQRAEAAQCSEQHSSIDPAMRPTGHQQSWPAPGDGSNVLSPLPKKQRAPQREKRKGLGKQEQQAVRPAVPAEDPLRSAGLLLDNLHMTFTINDLCDATFTPISAELQFGYKSSNHRTGRHLLSCEVFSSAAGLLHCMGPLLLCKEGCCSCTRRLDALRSWQPPQW